MLCVACADDVDVNPDKVGEELEVFDADSGVRRPRTNAHDDPSSAGQAQPGGGVGTPGDQHLAIVCEDNFVFRRPAGVRLAIADTSSGVRGAAGGDVSMSEG